MHKVTVIGAGSVGATIAYTLAAQSLASEIVLIDVNNEKALGEALDIRQGMPFCGPVKIYAGTYADSVFSDIVIICSGVARRAGQSRLDLAQVNVGIMRDISDQIVKYAPDAIYILVANPVDILTYAFHKFSGLPENQIIGSGTVLDTARLQARLSECLGINQQNVQAYVFGEHGDTAFIPWSLASVAGIPLDSYTQTEPYKNKMLPPIELSDVENYIKISGAKVISRKGATFYAVALAVCHICRCIFYSTETLLTVSTMLHGEYGVSDVCLSALTEVSKIGHDKVFVSPITDKEEQMLRASAASLDAILHDLKLK